MSFGSDSVDACDLPIADILPERVRSRRKSELQLTSAQLRVVALVADGMPNKKIAYALQLSEATVKAHVNQAMKRVGLTNRVQLAVWYVRKQPVEDEACLSIV